MGDYGKQHFVNVFPLQNTFVLDLSIPGAPQCTTDDDMAQVMLSNL